MKFLSLFTPAPRPGPPSPEYRAAMERLIEESTKAGTLLWTGGLLPIATAARVRRCSEEITITDGPFAETKEVAGGFAILEARSRDHAIELSKAFLEIAGDGVTEIRQIMEPGDAPCAS